MTTMPNEVNYVQKLAVLVKDSQFAQLSGTTVHKAKMHLLDTLGAALAGACSDEVDIASSLIRFNHASDDVSPIWGRNFYASPRDCAFINAIAAHAYELDDCGGCDHSGAVVVPAIFALLPTLPVKCHGQDLLLSMVMGYEVGRRILEACGGYETHNDLGWHSTGTCGVFGAGVAAGLMLDLDCQKLCDTIGIAGSYAGGTWSFIHDGSQTKKLHTGRAAEGGVIAALLAKAGFQGPHSILQPNMWGSYLSAFGQDKGRAEMLTQDFGVNWRLNRCSIKPYATCRGTHSAIDALTMLLAQHHLNTTDIAQIKVRMSVFQAGMCGSKNVATRAQAQMSLPYALAARLIYGQVSLQELTETAYRNAQVQNVMAQIEIVVDEAMEADAEPEITVIAEKGQEFTASVAYPLGSPRSPLADEKIIGKFVDLAADRLKTPQIQHIIDYVLTIEVREDVRHLPSLLISPQ